MPRGKYGTRYSLLIDGHKHEFRSYKRSRWGAVEDGVEDAARHKLIDPSESQPIRITLADAEGKPLGHYVVDRVVVWRTRPVD
jgi:hypothetical protein